ncbi:MAG: Bug family tripartite tricarboxylate transporter substrate binding protein [Pigmentiphaga sp.]
MKVVRGLLIFAAALSLAWGSMAGASADYPSRPITLVVPFPAGGSPDAYARIMAEGMAERLGTPLVVEARPGAGSSLGTQHVARSQADGYTLMLATLSFVTSPLLYSSASWDAAGDFDGIAEIATAPSVAVVPAAFPANTLQEFVDYAKKRPGEVNYLMPGRGTSMHLNSELLRLVADLDMVAVPYQGVPPGLPDLMSGRLSMTMSPMSLVGPHIKTGALKALAVAAPQRLKELPDIPTFAEAGFSDAEVVSWYTIVAPAGTPRDVVAKLNRAANDTLQDPKVVQKLVNIGGIVSKPKTPQEVDDLLASEAKRWRELFPKMNIKAE